MTVITNAKITMPNARKTLNEAIKYIECYSQWMLKCILIDLQAQYYQECIDKLAELFNILSVKANLDIAKEERLRKLAHFMFILQKVSSHLRVYTYTQKNYYINNGKLYLVTIKPTDVSNRQIFYDVFNDFEACYNLSVDIQDVMKNNDFRQMMIFIGESMINYLALKQQ